MVGEMPPRSATHVNTQILIIIIIWLIFIVTINAWKGFNSHYKRYSHINLLDLVVGLILVMNIFFSWLKLDHMKRYLSLRFCQLTSQFDWWELPKELCGFEDVICITLLIYIISLISLRVVYSFVWQVSHQIWVSLCTLSFQPCGHPEQQETQWLITPTCVCLKTWLWQYSLCIDHSIRWYHYCI